MPGSGNSVGQISLDLGLNDAQFQRQAKGLEKTTKKAFTGLTSFLSNFLANVASNLLNTMLSGFGNFVKESINLASDLQEVENVVDTVFSNMEKEVDSFTQNAMNSFGLSELVAKQYMGQLGAMAKAFGYTEKESYNLARSITGLTGDVASFYNLSTDEAFTKLKSIFTGETESLKSLGIVMTQSALDAFALANGFGKTTDQMSEAEKVALRYKFVMNQLSVAQGDFAKTSNSWANQTRVLGLEFDILKSTLGEGFIIALTPAIQMLNTFIRKLQDVATNLVGFIKYIMGVSDETASVGEGSNIAADATGEMADNMKETEKSAEKAKKSLLGFDELNRLSDPTGASDAKGDLGSFDWGEMGDSLDEVTKDSENKFIEFYESVTQSFKKTTGSLLKHFKKVFGEVKRIINPLYTSIADFGTSVFNLASQTIDNFFRDHFDDITDNINFIVSQRLDLLENLVGTATGILDIITTSIENSTDSLAKGLSDIIGGTLSFITDVLGVGVGVVTTFMRAVNTWVTENEELLTSVLTNLFTFVGEMGTFVGGVLKDVGESLKDWWANSFEPIFYDLLGIIGDIGAKLLDLWNRYIFPIVNHVKDKLSELWDETLKPLFDDLLEFFSAIGAAVTTLWDNIIEPIVDLIISFVGPKVQEALTEAADKVLEAFGTMFGVVSQYIRLMTAVLKGFTEFIDGVFSGDLEKAFNGILTIAKAFANAIISLIETMVNSSVTALNAVLNGALNILINQVNQGIKAAKAVGSLFTDTSDWELIPTNVVDIPGFSLPRLADGGYLRANQPTLAVVGDNRREGEIVAPESKIAEAVARGISQVLGVLPGLGESSSTPIEIVVQIGDEVLIDRIINGINRENRRAGRIIIKA